MDITDLQKVRQTKRYIPSNDQQKVTFGFSLIFSEFE